MKNDYHTNVFVGQNKFCSPAHIMSYVQTLHVELRTSSCILKAAITDETTKYMPYNSPGIFICISFQISLNNFCLKTNVMAGRFSAKGNLYTLS